MAKGKRATIPSKPPIPVQQWPMPLTPRGNQLARGGGLAGVRGRRAPAAPPPRIGARKKKRS